MNICCADGKIRISNYFLLKPIQFHLLSLPLFLPSLLDATVILGKPHSSFKINTKHSYQIYWCVIFLKKAESHVGLSLRLHDNRNMVKHISLLGFLCFHLTILSDFLWLSSISQTKCWDSTLKQVTIASFHILSNSSLTLISHLTLYNW